jgi:hypothetical protein
LGAEFFRQGGIRSYFGFAYMSLACFHRSFKDDIKIMKILLRQHRWISVVFSAQRVKNGGLTVKPRNY